MNDERVWEFEESLWTGGADHYREAIDGECLMVLPEEPFVFTGAEAIRAVEDTPRWSQVSFSDRQVARPQEGLIVMSYKAEARREERRYTAWCTTTIRRCAHDEWRVLQHQQTIIPGAA